MRRAALARPATAPPRPRPTSSRARLSSPPAAAAADWAPPASSEAMRCVVLGHDDYDTIPVGHGTLSGLMLQRQCRPPLRRCPSQCPLSALVCSALLCSSLVCPALTSHYCSRHRIARRRAGWNGISSRASCIIPSMPCLICGFVRAAKPPGVARWAAHYRLTPQPPSISEPEPCPTRRFHGCEGEGC
jgi:hypothetical protein